MARPKGDQAVPVIAEVRQGQAFRPIAAKVLLPATVYARGEEIYLVADTCLVAFGVRKGDLLIVESRTSANTGELVLARKGDAVYVGRFRSKHGRNDLVSDNTHEMIAHGVLILGSVNLIVRGIRIDG